MKSLAGVLALAIVGAAHAAEFHAYAGTSAVSTTTSTYGVSNTTLLGQGPMAGALISQKSAQSSGMVSGFDARSFTQGQRVRQETGMTEWFGGLNDQSVAGMQGLLHVRGWVNLSGYFLPLTFIQVTPGFALGYTSGLTGSGGDSSRVRVTPALSIAYQNTARLTYRQSPWSLSKDSPASIRSA
ncbi:MAG: hypothetical protein M0Z76_06015 [Gammaproteobacteria bacterium]|nr:hypothetical protein [Gammaproteobacteria bacterium]